MTLGLHACGTLTVLNAFTLQALGCSLFGRDIGLTVKFLDQGVEREAIFNPDVSNTGAAQGCQVSSAVQRQTDVACQGADVGTLAAHHPHCNTSISSMTSVLGLISTT